MPVLRQLSNPLSTPEPAKLRLENLDVQPIPLAVLLLDRWGAELLLWSDATILLESRDDFNAQLPEANLAKLRAVIGLMTTNDFNQRPFWFLQYTRALNLGELNLDVLQLPSLKDCAWALHQAQLIDPQEMQPGRYSPEVLLLLKQLAEWEGVLMLPATLRPWLENVWTDSVPWDQLRTDDPESFAMVFQQHQFRAREVDQAVMSRLSELLRQLEDLPTETDLRNLKLAVLRKFEALEQLLQQTAS